MTRPLRILFVTDAFPPHAYGSGWSTYHLARGLRAQGHAVRIVMGAPVRRLVETNYDGFPVWRAAPQARTVNPAAFSVVGLGPGRTMRRLVREWRPDVIHAQHVNAATVARTIAKRVPLIVTVRDHWPTCFYGTALSAESCPACLHGTLSACNTSRGTTEASALAHTAKSRAMRFVLRQRRQTLQSAAGVIALSEAIAEEVRPLLDPRCVQIVPNAVDDTVIAQQSGDLATLDIPPRYFIYAGKLSWHKGADLLTHISAHLGADAPPILVLGDGPEAEALRAFDPTGQRVRLLGVVPNTQAIALMARALALIFPSRWAEPLSRTQLEAMAVGCPIVATSTGGTVEAVADGETGFLTGVDDAAAMARYLSRLATEPALRERISRAARDRSTRLYSLPAVTARVLAVYTAAIVDSTRPHSVR